MLRIGRHFQFEAPDGWQESREGSRWVYRSNDGQELIIASSHVDGGGALMDRERAKQDLLSDALAAAAEGATQEGLVNTIPIKRDEAVTELPCWSFSSETPGKEAVFVGAVFGSDDGVLFATLEGPYSPVPLGIFHRFLRSVRRPAN